jgi:hypothetical protein
MDARLVALLVFVLVLGAGLAGAWIACRFLVTESASPSFGAVQGAAFGILGLLLAFSFSVGLTRYDARREVVVREANAIKTLWYRAGLLDHARTLVLRKEVAAYAAARLDYSAADDAATRATAQLHAANLESAVWSDVLNGTNRGQAIYNLLIQAANDVFDVAAEQSELQSASIPASVIAVVIVTALVAALLLGAAYGRARRHALVAQLSIAVVIAMVVATIIDLDRPQHGLIRVDLAPLLQTQSDMNPSP